MRTTWNTRLALATSLLLTFLVTDRAFAQSTAFTYQGRLEAAGVPANIDHAFLVRLFDQADGGNQIGSTVCEDSVQVVNGLFIMELDFGMEVASNSDRFLDVQVKEDGDCSDTTGYTQLSPRQRLTATPRATQAARANAAFRLDAPDGSPTAAVFVDNSGNVGMGTITPTSKLQIIGDVRWGGFSTDQARSGQDGSGLFLEQRGSSAAKSNIRLQTSRSGDLANYSQFFIDPNAGFAFTTLGTGNGNVGIGTTTPAAKLDVRGDIRLGPSGEFHAASGEERLRIVRGSVFSNGNPSLGAGFSSVRTETGHYTITFNPPFNARPVVTASVVGGIIVYANIESISSSQATVFTVSRQDDEGFADANFHFIAVGPR